MTIQQARSCTSAGDRHKYANIFLTIFTIKSAYQDKTEEGFIILINQLPIYDFGQSVILCSQPIDMDLHLIKNAKIPVNKFDAVNKG